jgi:hypothetical protein
LTLSVMINSFRSMKEIKMLVTEMVPTCQTLPSRPYNSREWDCAINPDTGILPLAVTTSSQLIHYNSKMIGSIFLQAIGWQLWVLC